MGNSPNDALTPRKPFIESINGFDFVKAVYVNEIGVSNFTKLMQLNLSKAWEGGIDAYSLQ